MKVTLAVLADYANITREGKLNILGVFDVIHAQNFPMTHPLMQLVMRFEADIAETGRTKKVEIQLMDADGKKVFALGGEFVIGPVKPGELYRSDHILTINNLKLEHDGDYRFDIFIDGQPAIAMGLPLKVLKRGDS